MQGPPRAQNRRLCKNIGDGLSLREGAGAAAGAPGLPWNAVVVMVVAVASLLSTPWEWKF